MRSEPETLATFTDKYGSDRVVHRSYRGALRVKREKLTPALKASNAIGQVIAKRIKEERVKRGWDMPFLARLVGMSTGNAKARIWAIENGTQRGGMRLGTLYVFAKAFGLEARDLLPAVADIAAELEF